MHTHRKCSPFLHFSQIISTRCLIADSQVQRSMVRSAFARAEIDSAPAAKRYQGFHLERGWLCQRIPKMLRRGKGIVCSSRGFILDAHYPSKCVILIESSFTRFYVLSRHLTRLNILNYNLHVSNILNDVSNLKL